MSSPSFTIGIQTHHKLIHPFHKNSFSYLKRKKSQNFSFVVSGKMRLVHHLILRAKLGIVQTLIILRLKHYELEDDTSSRQRDEMGFVIEWLSLFSKMTAEPMNSSSMI